MDISLKSDAISAIAKSLRAELAAFQEKPIIEGAITLPNDDEFSYWWFLEFGTGSRFQNTSTDGLPKPSGVASNQGRSGPYPITHRANLSLAPGARKRRVRFMMHGRFYYRVLVMHPGARPGNRGRGIVRLAIRKAQIDISSQLEQFKKRRNRLGFPVPPTRRELLTAVNTAIREAHATIRRLTPVDRDSPHPSHLRDAWSYRKAK